LLARIISRHGIDAIAPEEHVSVRVRPIPLAPKATGVGGLFGVSALVADLQAVTFEHQSISFFEHLEGLALLACNERSTNT